MKIFYSSFSTLLYITLAISQGQQKSVDILKENARAGREVLLQQQMAQRDQQLFRQAQNLVNLNRFDHAISLLEDLVSRNPDHSGYYDALRRAYLITSRLPEADSLVNLMQQRDPQNVQFRIDRGTILYHQNLQDPALQLWHDILEENPSNISIISQVGATLQENNLPDEAIAIYQNAMERNPNAGNFNLNVAHIYRQRLMYAEATHYYLQYLNIFPEQQAYVFNQILAFQIEPEQQPGFFQVIENIASQDNISSHVNLLLAQLYQRYRKFENAFQIYLKLEEPKGDGLKLISFAQSAQRDSSYQVALRAYRYVINRYPDSPHLIQAYSGCISTLFQLAQQQSQQSYGNQALALIDSAGTRFPRHPEISRLEYMKGLFYLDFYFDVDKAIDIFSSITQVANVNPAQRNEIILKTGECLMIKGELDKAIQTFSRIRQLPFAPHAQLYSAQSYYFQGDWENSQKILQSIIQNQGIAGEVTNDALSLQVKIVQLQRQSDLLQKFSRAEYLVFQRKKSEAIKKYIEITESQRVAPSIKSEAYFQIGKLSLDMQEPEQALQCCNRAVKDPDILLYGDRHLFLMATILHYHLNKPLEAFAVYRDLLELYPNSLLADSCRDQMIILRQQNSMEIP